VDLSLSSDEEGLIPDTSWDAEFTKRLFGDLNRDFHGHPDDDKVIILSNSDEEEEVREEITVDAEVASSSAAGISPSTTFVAVTDEALKGVQADNSDDQSPGQEAGSP
jgi:hypothetical protein